MLGEPTYMKYGAGGSVGHAPWHKPTGQAQPTPHMDTPTPNVASKPDPMKAPRGLPSLAPKNMDPAYMQQQAMQKAMMGQGPRPMANAGGRIGFATGKEVIEKSIITGPDTALPPDIKKILDVIGGGAGIATIGLPKWLMSKLIPGGVRSNLAKKYMQLAKENRFRDARQLLTAQDPYIGEDPEMSEAKRTFRKYSRRVPTEEEEEFKLSPEMIEEGWRYPGRRSRGVPHERTAKNKRGYANGGLAQVLGV